MPETIQIPPWLASLPQEEGFFHISRPRRFAHEEERYDEQYQNEPDLAVGRGVIAAARGGDLSGPALEIGCGTGLVSLGLVAGSPYPLTVLTDPSPAFLAITRRKLEAAGIAADRAAFAVLTGEELDRLPESELSLVVLRSTLHHVLDVEKFIADAARSLRPGGVLTFQEPCLEGYILMGALAQVLPELARAGGAALEPADEERVRVFVETMKFYSRRDLDKSGAEDKHLFRVDELMRMGDRAGVSIAFLPNTTYDALAAVPPIVGADGPREPLTPECPFTGFFRSYARFCMTWPPALMEAFERFLAPHCRFVEEAGAGGSGPYLHGVFVGRKR